MIDRLSSLFDKIASRPEPSGGPPEYIVAGLGNPGREYEGTRHNAGFVAIDALAAAHGASISRIRFKALCGDAVVAGRRVLLLKPQNYMNLSGESVRDAAEYYRIPMSRVIVLVDDIDLPVGRLRVRAKGSAGGHNGLKNIIYLTGSDEFPRVRIGVDPKPRPDFDLADWVLGKIPREKQEIFGQAVQSAASAAEEIIRSGVASAANQYNGMDASADN